MIPDPEGRHRKVAPPPRGWSAGGLFDVHVNLRSIGVTPAWFVAQSRRLEAAGYAGVGVWDHFVSRGELTDAVLESWTTLVLTAGATRRLRLMTFVLNVMNRHPAVLARMAATLQVASEGRLVLGIGIGGHPAEHAAYGIAFPPAAERIARLEDAVAVLRTLWDGGPATRASPYYPLRDAWARPVPDPRPPILVGAETVTGALLAARLGDGWTVPGNLLRDRAPRHLEGLAAAGRARADVRVYAAFELGRSETLAASEWTNRPAEAAAHWRSAGADGAVVGARTERDVDLLVEAAGRR